MNKDSLHALLGVLTATLRISRFCHPALLMPFVTEAPAGTLFVQFYASDRDVACKRCY
ncbi:MAG: hypothetical protein V7721_03860 [Porticoccaceae bacterium]